MHGDRYRSLSQGRGPVPRMATIAIGDWPPYRYLSPFWSCVNFLHSTTVAIVQSGENPPEQRSLSVPVSVYLNKPLAMLTISDTEADTVSITLGFPGVEVDIEVVSPDGVPAGGDHLPLDIVSTIVSHKQRHLRVSTVPNLQERTLAQSQACQL